MNWQTLWSDWWRLLQQIDRVAVLDIALVAVGLYYLLALAQGTRAMQLLKGLATLLVIMQLAQWLGLDTLQWIIRQAIFASAVVVVILFQPELRAALDQIGRGQFTALGMKARGAASDARTRAVTEITKACEQLASTRTGALIVIERETGLEDIAMSGTRLNAQLSADVLQMIFISQSPLHDGAVLLHEDTILAAACILPLSPTQALPRTVGTRHRAALGLSEMTDALVVVVSEETGNISLAHAGTMTSILEPRLLAEELSSLLGRAEGAARLRPFARSVTNAARSFPRTTWGTVRAALKKH